MTGSEHSSPDPGLVAVLTQARDHGALGPGPVEPQIEHARGFVDAAGQGRADPPGQVVDLGSGGGVPGLVLAGAWPAARVALIEAIARRARDLEAAVLTLFGPDGPERVAVVQERAEDVARRHEYREQADLVTARGFGRPALTAEIASGFLAVGGWLVVSEPPGGDPARWPEEGLAALGLGPARLVVGRGATYALVEKTVPAPDGVPRSTRPLVKRPAW